MALNSTLQDVLRWCQRNAPVVSDGLRPGATSESIAAFELALGFDIGASARDLFAIVDGELRTGPIDSWPLLPIGFLFSMEEILELRSGYLGEMSSRSTVGEPGEPTADFRTSFLPLAGIDGDYLYLDLRPGDRRGCVAFWDHVNGNPDGALWPNLTALLEDLWFALKEKRPLMDRQVFVEASGGIEWVHIHNLPI